LTNTESRPISDALTEALGSELSRDAPLTGKLYSVVSDMAVELRELRDISISRHEAIEVLRTEVEPIVDELREWRASWDETMGTQFQILQELAAALTDALVAAHKTDTESIAIDRARLESLVSAERTWQIEREGLWTEIRLVRAQLERQQRERQRVESVLHAMYASTSWRISAPLRFLKRLFAR
jgi:hypothetical protein